ncbi:Glycosyltransferase involved in cell wall bisynthesis [Anaerobium acetethylicum]|uniref:Glycosyltransferase involved in cell wall bisynthesis n=1 Tax=Anaerobium acetethylicum TaxID=1619234 RepID=A0A1D3TWP0_9FIRM|nr:Glycosyltransferase involved in cell wall bisynthesis [Anaerobium acetethylicum]
MAGGRLGNGRNNLKVCLILEGSYPYVYGGVSSWTHQYIQAMPDVEFILWCIAAKAEERGKFKFQIPGNVTEIHEVFLDDALKMKASGRNKVKLRECEAEELEKLLECRSLNWDTLFELFQNKRMKPMALMTSLEFWNILENICLKKYPFAAFSDFFHTVRSMLLPELFLMTKEVPEADIYHATATGYSGLLGSMGKWKYGKPFILTEHGIYTREREEEILRAKWVIPYYKQQWIDLFYTFSDCAYSHADVITALFERANRIQEDLGCNPQKLRVLPNGVHYDRFSGIPVKKKDGYIDIGAVVRIAKIKDIKTMIYAFAELKISLPESRLHIMGDVDDEEYFTECRQLVQQLGTEDIIFTGVVNVIEYMEKFDFTILTSISEGQPLSVLESFAAKRPCVVTDVGCCRELIDGSREDAIGAAGICVAPMNKEALTHAMYRMATDENMRMNMGEAGQERVRRYYTHESSMSRYKELYKEVV